jgi:replicative DNA helicase
MPTSRKKEKTREKLSPTVFDREPPKSIEAERSMLGAILLNPESLSNALEIFGFNTDNIFYHHPHQTIFDAINDIYQNSQNKPDINAVASYLESKKQLADVGGVAYLSELINCVSTSGNINYYATTVMEMALLRRLIDRAVILSEEPMSHKPLLRNSLTRQKAKFLLLLLSERQIPFMH